MVVFYVLCLLYVLSTASVVCDLLIIIISESELYSQVSNNPICYLKIFFFISHAESSIVAEFL